MQLSFPQELLERILVEVVLYPQSAILRSFRVTRTLTYIHAVVHAQEQSQYDKACVSPFEPASPVWGVDLPFIPPVPPPLPCPLHFLHPLLP